MDTLHTISRRLFLKSAAAATVALPIAAAGATAPLEAPGFLTVSAELDAALAACDDAREHKAAARSLFERIQPVVPEELVGGSIFALFYGATGELDAEGQPIREGGSPRFIVSSQGLSQVMSIRGALVDEPERSRMRKLLRIARKHERAVIAARIGAGLDEAIQAYFWSCDRLRRAILTVLETPSATSAGLVTKARAYSAIAQVPDWGAMPSHGQMLADAVLTALGEVAA